MTAAKTHPSAVVAAFLEAFAAMDFDRALAHVAEDAEYTHVPMGTVRGHGGVLDAGAA